MLHYAAAFVAIASVAAVVGVGDTAVGAAGFTKALLVTFLIGALVALARRRPGTQ